MRSRIELHHGFEYQFNVSKKNKSSVPAEIDRYASPYLVETRKTLAKLRFEFRKGFKSVRVVAIVALTSGLRAYPS